MSIKGLVKTSANSVLRHVNVQVDSLTLERAEERRLREIAASGYFERRPFPIPSGFQEMNVHSILDDILLHEERFCAFDSVPVESPRFSFSNDYFTSPDAEVLYSIVHRCCPTTVIEVGSGNSTKLLRQVITDSGSHARLISVDPEPRANVDAITDSCVRAPVESLDPQWLAGQMSEDDIFFIDSSHTLKPCGDVAFLYLRVLPLLPQGVLVHIHDVFLPYDYPREWVVDARWPWNEQYLVQALLDYSDDFQVIWAGCYLQRTLPDFARTFPRAAGRRASSLWLRKRSNVHDASRTDRSESR